MKKADISAASVVTENATTQSRGEVIIYRTQDGRTALDVRLIQETVWLTQKQMALLFSTDRSSIAKHIGNILKRKELNRVSVCAKFAHTAEDGKTYQAAVYNLDMIIAIGYRVNSKRGTQFRIWATQVLRDHLLNGYTVNEKRLREQVTRLKELQETVDLLGRVIQERQLTGNEAEGLLKVVTDYSLALTLLDQYDHQQLAIRDITAVTPFELTYDAAKVAIAKMGAQAGMGGLFGQEKDESFKSSIGTIYQTFGGKELYPSIEEKAAHLLYFVIKNHSFVDGNKRIAAFLFIWFLDANRILYRKDGTKRLADNALVALPHCA
ncbi:MAG: virulence RhuM family protein [Magnetococcus sp. WYHC-3]